MGTAEFACPSLEALATTGEHKIVAVVTQPDRPRGRELKLTHSPVKEVALGHHLQIFQPDRVKNASFIQTLGDLHPDVIVVIAYGQILSKDILRMPGHGCINVHGSLLPKYRGASPIQAALLHGESETGVTTMFMDEGLDTGDMILQENIPVEPADNAQTVHDRLAEKGARLLLRTLRLLAEGEAPRQKQDDSRASVCKKISKEDGRLDWNLPAHELWNRIRAYNPWPSAFVYLQTKRGRKLVKLWSAAVVPGNSPKPGTVIREDKNGIVVATGHGSLLIKEIQLEGGRRLQAADFAIGHDLRVGTVLE